MRSPTSPTRTEAPRPLDAREIGAKLDDLLAAVADLAGAPPDGTPRPLSVRGLLSCLAPLTSRN